MTSTRNPLQDFILTPQQQSLLFAALNSNKANAAAAPASALNLSPSSMTNSPVQGTDSMSTFQESPYLDYDYDFGGADSSFDFSFDNGKMIGDLPGAPSDAKSDSPEMDSPDKRSHPDDEDDDENMSGGGKRRESEDKVAKKPGRKPLTTEPSSKRKAQNRAAQRAFRERKEKHLKDLETKVQELEKSSETTNHENKLLRAKVEKMTVELNEYKKRISLLPNSRPTAAAPTFGRSFLNNINDVNFQFEFPKFGALPGPPVSSNNKKSPLSRQGSSGPVSPLERPKDAISPGNSSTYSQIGMDSQSKEDLANFSASLFNAPLTNTNIANASRSSLDSHFSMSGGTTTSSPSASSNSNMGASSSCGTSPEPFTQSPMGFKPVDTLTTIGEEHSGMNGLGQEPDFSHLTNVDGTDFNWLPQNNFQFDPQLFGGYREPQENVLSTGFDDSFFNDAFDMDFTTPYNMPTNGTPAPAKKDLIAEIDDAKNADEVGSNVKFTVTDNQNREKLQNCPKVQNGDFDLDGLCSDLQKKAKCSGSGAVVDEKDFHKVMQKYLGKTDKEIAECTMSMAKSSAETA